MEESLARKIEYLDKTLYDKVKEEISKKIPASYVRNLQILREYKKRGGKVKYSGPGTKPSQDKVKERLKEEHKNKVKRKEDKKKSSAAIYEIDIFASEISQYNFEYNEIFSSNLIEEEKQELIKIHKEIYNEK